MNAAPSQAPKALPRALFEHISEALLRTLRLQGPADAVLSAYFRQNRGLGQRDRSWIAETVYGVLRHLRSLQGICAADANPRLLAALWLLRFYGVKLQELQNALSPREIERLSTLAKVEAQATSLGEALDLPDWLADRLHAQRGKEALRKLAHALNAPAPLDLRVNSLKAERETVLDRLNADGIVAVACPYSPLAVRIAGNPQLSRHPLFVEGAIEVQDEGSQLLGYLLAPRRGEMVIDFCAGAGGKTLMLGALMRSTGRLYALDVAERRLARLRPRAARAGLSNLHIVAIDSESDNRLKRYREKADRVLVDAPCSGLGTLRRNPDLKWRQTPESLGELVIKQAAILAAAARLVRPGGTLVYATCSLLAEENEDIVEPFLAAHPEFELEDASAALAAQKIPYFGERSEEKSENPSETSRTARYLRLDPVRHGTDGFFAALLRRRDSDSSSS